MRRQLLVLVIVLGGLSACRDTTAPIETGAPVPVFVRTSIAGTAIAIVVVRVTGPGISVPLVFNLDIGGGVASGVVTVPAGSSRTIRFEAYDAAGIETHRGEVVVDVHSNLDTPIHIVLQPLTGDVPIDVVLGTVTIAIFPAADTLLAGDTVTLTARVVDSSGNPVTVPVRWATVSPSVARVAGTSDSTGLVTAMGAGATSIVATVAGFAGVAGIVVSEPELVVVAMGLDAPLYLTAPPGDTSRLFVVEKTGRIRIIKAGAIVPTPFLDLRGQVTTSGERGLLGLAFSPAYHENGNFYLNYTGSGGATRIARYTVSMDPDVADPSSAEILLTVTQPFSNHNGGNLAFGPDGMLYIGFGDGGSGGDPLGHGQDSTTLLGALLRLDVDGASPYAIPPDNPFAGHDTARPEIWAYGLRNPWRFSFDRETGDLYIGDVGQQRWEEVNFRPAASAGGENYGWNVMEGLVCFGAEVCDQEGITLPVHVYQTRIEGCAVVGGYVYRGTAVPALRGRYLYGDFCETWVRSFRIAGDMATDHRDHSDSLGPVSGAASFGEDARGELYIVSLEGTVWRITAG